jgi:hypothetical protein
LADPPRSRSPGFPGGLRISRARNELGELPPGYLSSSSAPRCP